MTSIVDISTDFLNSRPFQRFTATTGVTSTAGALTFGACLFNAGVNNFIYVESIRYTGGNGGALHTLTTGTTKLALTNTATPRSLLLQSGLASLAVMTWQVTATAITGTVLDAYDYPGVNGGEWLTNGIGIGMPALTPASLNLFVVAAGAGACSITYKWREYALQ